MENNCVPYRCPVCGGTLTLRDERVYRCDGPRTHCFDRAASGYVNLAGNHQGAGDSKEAVRSRRAFLDSGAYAPIAEGIEGLLGSYLPVGASLLDAGCGEGYYTNRLASRGYCVDGLDLSRDAVDAAAKRARAGKLSARYCVASIFSLPFADAAFDGAISVFAPCAGEEFARVLKTGGYLLVVGAGPRHLLELKEILYETTYLNEGRADLPAGLLPVERRNVCTTVQVQGQELIQALFSMTPYYWRTSPGDRRKLDVLEALSVTVDVDLMLYRKDGTA